MVYISEIEFTLIHRPFSVQVVYILLSRYLVGRYLPILILKNPNMTSVISERYDVPIDTPFTVSLLFVVN